MAFRSLWAGRPVAGAPLSRKGLGFATLHRACSWPARRVSRCQGARRGVPFGHRVEGADLLTVRDLATMPDLELPVAAGAKGLGNAVSWLHVSELADPTRWLEGGEFLLTTGLGLGEAATSQRAYVRRLARHGIAGLGFGIGFGFADGSGAGRPGG